MNKRQLLYLGFTILVFAVAMVFTKLTTRSGNASDYIATIEKHLHDEESFISDLLNDEEYILRQVADTNPQLEADFEILEKLSNRSFTISIFKNDSLSFWTNNKAIPDLSDIANIGIETQPIFIRHPNGYYALSTKHYEEDGNRVLATALIPIKYKYGLESQNLSNRFVADVNIPKEISISSEVSELAIISKNGKTLCYLNANQPYIDKNRHKASFLLFALAFFSLFLFINSIAITIARTRKPWIGAAFLMLSVFAIRGISIAFDFTGFYSDLAIFSRSFETPIFSDSLGDLLINVLLLLWVIFYFQKEFSFGSFAHLSKPMKFTLTTLNSFAIILALIMVAGVFKNLVLNSGIIFNFDNVFQMGRFSILALAGVVFLLMVLFLFSHRMAQTNIEIGLSKYDRLYSLGGALLLSVPVMLISDLMLPPVQVLLFSFIFVVLFDFFLETRSATLTWLIIWLVIFAAFSSILSFKYSNDKDLTIRLANAKALSDLRDNIAEEKFSNFEQTIQSDKYINNIPQPIPFLINQNKIRDPIDGKFEEDNYLFDNYSYRVYAYNKYGVPAVEGQNLPKAAIDQKIEEAESTAFKDLKFLLDPQGNSVYLMATKIPNHSNPDNPLLLYFEFAQKNPSKSKVYTELLEVRHFKNLENIDKYDYAIYKNGEQIGKKSKLYANSFPFEKHLPALGQSDQFNRESRSELIYRSPDDIVVVIGRKWGGLIKPLSLFSFLFLLLICATFILAGINTFIKAIPDALDFSVLRHPSLRNRIQVYFISLILVSFIIIGALTIIFFRQEFDSYHEGRLGRKTETILGDTQREIELLLAETGFEIDPTVISKIHRMDMNVFAPDGRLQSSSEYDFFEKRIIAPVMNPIAYQRLAKLGKENVQINESVGDIQYLAAYVPLTNADEEVIAFLGLPYYSEQGKLRSEVMDFMGFIINAFAFLLLIAGAIAIYIANSITKPLDQVGNKLKQFQLGGKNELLTWKTTDDEIGALVGEYNRLAQKLEESAELLAQNERDSAWREMAKQVAHEIKNPLTPMKLSIQYLRHAYQSNPNDIEPLLKRVSGTLIEQIDNLAQIATEFSSFAKMPRAQNSKFVVNDLVNSVHELFSKGEEEAELSLELPDEDVLVFADKNQLMRVLNNLIKNAVQAIPDDRDGKVKISLFKEAETAVIKVSDNGTGIPKEMRDKVFVPNFTTKSSGTGIGLAISKNIIESVNGQIYFQTEIGKGTDFFVKLPLESVKELEEA